tara:strand:+ start:15390 stop:15710 length:321 start_codon:yes stop_codon:yes gene_type:complete
MAYVIHQNDSDPGMRYEGLARFAFDCARWGGPNNVAQQSVYNSLFIPDTNDEGILVLTQILDSLIEKYQGHTKQEFIDLKTSLTAGMEQRTAIELIDYIIQIVNQE